MLALVVLPVWAAQPAGALAEDSPVGEWEERRCAADALFADELRALAVRCDELGLVREAAFTRSWVIARGPRRQYIFLPPAARVGLPDATDSDAARFWWQHFCTARDAQAERLFALAREAAEVRPAWAYQLLHETLRENPGHEAARRALGYRRDGDRWMLGGDDVVISPGRDARPEYGWKSGDYQRIDSPHFRIVTNADAATGRDLVSRLEDLQSVWRQVFYTFWSDGRILARRMERGAPDPSPRGEKYRLVWFRDRQQYLDVLRRDEPLIDKTLGIYLDKRRMVFLYGDPAEMLSTWLHEVTHQLFAETRRAAADVGARGNVWVVEALALYMESLQWHDGFCTLGGFDAERYQYARYRLLNEQFYLPLADLVRLDRRGMQQDPQIRALYSQAAGLAHFFLTAEQGQYQPLFVDYVGRVYRGQDQPTSLVDCLRLPAERLDELYRQSLELTDADLHAVAPAVDLYLGRSAISDAGLRRLPLERLELLDVGYTRVGDEGVRYLAGAQRLRRLTLEHTQVTAAGLMPLSGMRQLEYLDLSGLPVDDAALAFLASLERLESLWLTDTRVTDEGLMHLARLSKLTTLDVSGTAVTPSGLSRLRELVPSLQPASPP